MTPAKVSCTAIWDKTFSDILDCDHILKPPGKEVHNACQYFKTQTTYRSKNLLIEIDTH